MKILSEMTKDELLAAFNDCIETIEIYKEFAKDIQKQMLKLDKTNKK